jgi:hypothetical protein
MAGIYARIQNASEHELRTVLAGLCADSDSTRNKTTRLFNGLDQFAKAYNQQKLPAPTPCICRNCQKPFDEADNQPNVCRYHEGEFLASSQRASPFLACPGHGN